MNRLKQQRHLIPGILLILLFAIGHTFYGLWQSNLGIGLGSDQLNIGIMSLKLRQPELFTNDYVFADSEFFSFYTPSFLNLAGWLDDWFGSYTRGLALLLLPIISLYTAGMWLLLASFTRNKWLALAIAIASAFVAETLGGTIWGVAELRVVIPRTLLLSFIPWWVWLWWRWRSREDWWRQPLFALLLGGAANLHPVSGLMLSQLFLLTEIWWGRNSWPKLRFWLLLLLSSLCLIVAVWPTAGNFINNSGLAEATTTAEDFSLFRQAMQFSFSTLFPFHSTRLQEWVGPAGQTILVVWQTVIVIVCVVYYVVTDKTSIFSRGMNSMAELGQAPAGTVSASARNLSLLILAQLPLIIFITDGSSIILLLILFSAALLLLWRPDSFPLQPVDQWAIFLLTAVCSLTLVGSFALEWVWNRYSWWSLTSLVGEQARMAKFIYLPLYLVAVRWLDWLLIRLGEQSKANQLFIVGLALSLALHRPVAPLILMLWLLAFLLLRTGLIKPWQWCFSAILLLVGTVLLTLTYLWAVTIIQLLILTAVALFCFYVWLSAQPFRQKAMKLLGALLLAVLSWNVADLLPARPVAQQIVPERYVAAMTEQEFLLDARELYDWARLETPTEAVFYTDAFELRFYAQRAITHSTKDWGTAYYRRTGLVAIAQRWQTLRTAYGDEALLLRRAAEVGADYLYVERVSDVRLDRPVVYSNDSYIVYDLSQ